MQREQAGRDDLKQNDPLGGALLKADEHKRRCHKADALRQQIIPGQRSESDLSHVYFTLL